MVTEYYGHNDWRDYHLSHHGVLGMRWGVRRYQPYGIGYQRNGGESGKMIGDARTYGSNDPKIQKRIDQKRDKLVAKQIKLEGKLTKHSDNALRHYRLDRQGKRKAGLGYEDHFRRVLSERKVIERTKKKLDKVKQKIAELDVNDVDEKDIKTGREYIDKYTSFDSRRQQAIEDVINNKYYLNNKDKLSDRAIAADLAREGKVINDENIAKLRKASDAYLKTEDALTDDSNEDASFKQRNELNEKFRRKAYEYDNTISDLDDDKSLRIKKDTSDDDLERRREVAASDRSKSYEQNDYSDKAMAAELAKRGKDVSDKNISDIKRAKRFYDREVKEADNILRIESENAKSESEIRKLQKENARRKDELAKEYEQTVNKMSDHNYDKYIRNLRNGGQTYGSGNVKSSQTKSVQSRNASRAKALAASGYTYAEIAKKLGISASSVSAYVNG